MAGVKSGAIRLFLELPEADEGAVTAFPAIAIDTMDLVDMAVDAQATSSLITAIHASGQSIDFADLILANIYEWAEADRLNAASEIADWLEAMAADLRQSDSFPPLDFKPRPIPGLR